MATTIREHIIERAAFYDGSGEQDDGLHGGPLDGAALVQACDAPLCGKCQLDQACDYPGGRAKWWRDRRP